MTTIISCNCLSNFATNVPKLQGHVNCMSYAHLCVLIWIVLHLLIVLKNECHHIKTLNMLITTFLVINRMCKFFIMHEKHNRMNVVRTISKNKIWFWSWLFFKDLSVITTSNKGMKQFLQNGSWFRIALFFHETISKEVVEEAS